LLAYRELDEALGLTEMGAGLLTDSREAQTISTCYHPLFLFNQFGDLEYAMLRRGNQASAQYWRRVLLPVIQRYRGYDIPKFFRGDAAKALAPRAGAMI